VEFLGPYSDAWIHVDDIAANVLLEGWFEAC